MTTIHNKDSIKIIATNALLHNMQKDGSLNQAKQVAKLPGLVGPALVMPDAHLGYGFPVGGAAAADAKEGFISPGGIGFDINCGIRLLRTNCTYQQIQKDIRDILEQIYSKVPVGMSGKSLYALTEQDVREILQTGVQWAIKNGIGTQEDAKFCEDNGCIAQKDISAVSDLAIKRGQRTLGTLGAGNHFVELQRVDSIFDASAAKAFGLKQDHVVIMIHCGSRGLGHQVATDYIDKFTKEFPDIVNALQERDLIYAPIQSKLGQEYLTAMQCAMNFAWTNRHVIAHEVRQVLNTYNITTETVYDIGHNNCKLETHTYEGNTVDVFMHRKGATRAFPKDHEEANAYPGFGHPVLIPGSMGTSSYVLQGTQTAMTETFGTVCHGAGRVMSRKKAQECFDADQINKELQEKNITLKAQSNKGVTDEAPGAYKDVDEVIKACVDAKLATTVVRLKPIGVIKG